MYSNSINNLLRAFKELPSVGGRTAERYVFHLLKSGKKEVTELMLALKELIENVKSCERCFDFSDTSPCALCRDTRRNQKQICVVAEPPDVQVMEKTGAYHGLYHVLRGLIDTTDEEHNKTLKLSELVARAPQAEEVVLALNPDLAGETTMLYLERTLREANPGITVSRLARGLPLGADIRYADEITLSSALKNRTSK